MQVEYSNQSSFFSMIYEELLPADHLLCKLAAAVNLSFVSDLVSDCSLSVQGTPLKLCPSCEGRKKYHGLAKARLVLHLTAEHMMSRS